MSSESGASQKLEKYIVARGQRIFIDISAHGCGSGCAYCYVDEKEEEQQLLSMCDIQSICELVERKYGCASKIISLCPNTEPLKSADSIKLILLIIRFFISRGSYVQISTKEKIPDYFLEEINGLARGRIFINISVPYITNADALEPGAASVSERLCNFILIEKYKNLNSCLYIKPFSERAFAEEKAYIDAINKYRVNTVCVGVNFDTNEKNPCQSLHNENVARVLFEKQGAELDRFVNVLRAHTKAKIFGSSVCCICSSLKQPCLLSLFNYDNVICEDCTCRERLPLSQIERDNDTRKTCAIKESLS